MIHTVTNELFFFLIVRHITLKIRGHIHDPDSRVRIFSSGKD